MSAPTKFTETPTPLSLIAKIHELIDHIAALLDTTSGHSHNGSDSKKIAYGDLVQTPSLATVATSGSYADLSNKPSLGNMAAKTLHEETVTLTAAGWSNKSQQISVSGMTTNAPGWYGPSATAANINAYDASGVYLASQGSGTMTFAHISDVVPEIDISVDIAYFL